MIPICPEQPGGWTCLVFRDQNISWKVIAKRGSRQDHTLQSIHVGRLTPEEIGKFNIERYQR